MRDDYVTALYGVEARDNGRLGRVAPASAFTEKAAIR